VLHSATGNAALAREKILSILGHVTGVKNAKNEMHRWVAGTHEFPAFNQFKRCEHGPLPADRPKAWMKEGERGGVY
jgi:hypothetical protein